MTSNDDELLFFEDEVLVEENSSPVVKEKWKVLIVDDEEEVHNVTKMALRRFNFEGKEVEFISAYSATEGKKLLAENMDIAVIFLDVVMEEEDSGLQMVRYIRTVMKNSLVRIILRTGQPGQAPEYNVVVEYDINDYREKTELTSQKLYTVLVTTLRSFRDLSIIEMNRRSLKKIIDSSASIFEFKSMKKFAASVLFQLMAILHPNPNFLYGHASGFVVTRKNIDEFYVLAAAGNYDNLLGGGEFSNGGNLRELKVWTDIKAAFSQKQSIYFSDRLVIYFSSKQGWENVIYLDGIAELNIWDQDLIEVFCANISVAFDNIYLNKEVEATQKEILFTLGEAAEARSEETGNHVKRVAEVAKLLALRYGLSQEEAELLRLATPIHDVGKLAIPDAILNKPGKLTIDEFVIMKSHSQSGYEMLKNSKRSILKSGALIALQHHERYDGSGYPQGLVGQEIHIYGRIVALADVFDALGSKRVYKKAWTLEAILEYISGQRGAHFDPKLVDIFMESLHDIKQIYREFPDE